MEFRNATRRQLMIELRASNVDFDEEATAVQLREVLMANINNQQQPDETQWSNAVTQQPEVKTQQSSAAAQQELIGQPTVLDQQRSVVAEQQSEVERQLEVVTQQSSAAAQRKSKYKIDLEEEEAYLDRMLAIANKKNELRRLQAEFTVADNKSIDLFTLDAIVNKFDGSKHQDVHKWVRDLENAFNIFNYSERDRLVAARHLVEGHAKSFIEIMPVIFYENLKKNLLSEFDQVFTMQDVSKMLQAHC